MGLAHPASVAQHFLPDHMPWPGALAAGVILPSRLRPVRLAHVVSTVDPQPKRMVTAIMDAVALPLSGLTASTVPVALAVMMLRLTRPVRPSK